MRTLPTQHKHLRNALMVLVLLAVPVPQTLADDCLLDTNNDGNADTNTDLGANSGGNNFRLACGDLTVATGNNSTALGSRANATGDNATAVGQSADATATNAIAIGDNAQATADRATAVGRFAEATASNAIAVGDSAEATATDTTVVGVDANATASLSTALGKLARTESTSAIALGVQANVPFTDSPASIALGYLSQVGAASPGAIAIGGDTDNSGPFPDGAQALGAQAIALGSESRTEVGATGAIAIGGDVDGDGVGAQATAPGAIAIGADVVADIADNMFVGVPVRVVPPSVGVSEKVLMRLENNGGVNFKLNDTSGGNGEWTFRTGSQGSKFVIGKTGSGVQEFQVFSGGNVTIAGTLTQSSSRTNKENIETINHKDILDKVLDLPISEWNYIHDQDHIKHIGPMAEDFHSLFDVGTGPKGISSIDATGIALAAIQGLKAEKDREISGLKQTIIEKDTKITELEQRLAMLETDRTRMVALEQSCNRYWHNNKMPSGRRCLHSKLF